MAEIRAQLQPTMEQRQDQTLSSLNALAAAVVADQKAKERAAEQSIQWLRNSWGLAMQPAADPERHWPLVDTLPGLRCKSASLGHVTPKAPPKPTASAPPPDLVAFHTPTTPPLVGSLQAPESSVVEGPLTKKRRKRRKGAHASPQALNQELVDNENSELRERSIEAGGRDLSESFSAGESLQTTETSTSTLT